MYDPHKYKKPSLTADIAVFRKYKEKMQLLLIKRGGHPFLGYFALPGGFSEEGESVDETAKRELYEETHLKDLCPFQLGLYSTPRRDPRMWVVSEAYVAFFSGNEDELCADDDAEDAKWFDIDIKTQDNMYTVFFSNGQEKMSISLIKKVLPGLCGNISKFEITDKGNLAFDHAQIIADAMHKISLL